MSSVHILAVDDDPLNLELLAEYLAPLAADVTCESSPEQAWATLQKPDFACELVLLDRMMPRMSGLEFLLRMRAVPQLSRLPVIIQTAAATRAELREGLLAGASFYLTKPFDQEMLLGLVRRALEQGRRRRKIEQDAHSAEGSAFPAQLRLLRSGRFRVKTLTEAQDLAVLLGGLCPNPTNVALGLCELLINAIEHGNLGITYAEKARLCQADRWREEIERRSTLPELADRYVTLDFELEDGLVRFTVTDMGAGFDWEPFLELDPDRAFHPNGRGIAMSRRCAFSTLAYRAPGNMVVATVDGTDEALAPISLNAEVK